MTDVELIVNATLAALDFERHASAARARRVAPIRRMYQTMTARQVSGTLWAAMEAAGMSTDEILGSGLSYASIRRVVELTS